MADETEYEFLTRTLALDENFPKECEKISADGWQLIPGTLPVAVYYLRRPKGMSAIGTMSIDDAGVTVIRDGKPVAA